MTPIRASDIYSLYPNAVSAKLATAYFGAYCVGGAIRRYVQRDRASSPFPSFSFVAETLVRANPALTYRSAERAAMSIVDANDQGAIDEAWWLADLALSATTSEVFRFTAPQRFAKLLAQTEEHRTLLSLTEAHAQEAACVFA